MGRHPPREPRRPQLGEGANEFCTVVLGCGVCGVMNHCNLQTVPGKRLGPMQWVAPKGPLGFGRKRTPKQRGLARHPCACVGENSLASSPL
jgi:hypothetical protein